jgi:hypothetical protein
MYMSSEGCYYIYINNTSTVILVMYMSFQEFFEEFVNRTGSTPKILSVIEIAEETAENIVGHFHNDNIFIGENNEQPISLDF